jgi:hypothetical protein
MDTFENVLNPRTACLWISKKEKWLLGSLWKILNPFFFFSKFGVPSEIKQIKSTGQKKSGFLSHNPPPRLNIL